MSERVVFAELDWKYDIFWNIKTEEWALKLLLFDDVHDLVLGTVEIFFLKSVHTCLQKEPPSVFERVIFAEFDWKYDIF